MNESSKATEAASYAVQSAEAWNWNEPQLAELNRHLDKPFGEVELFNRRLAFALHQSGHEVEFSARGKHWIKTDPPLWLGGCRYRILPKREVV